MKKERRHTKEALEKITAANRKNAQDPKWVLKNLAAVPIRIAALKEKWKDPVFRDQQIEERKARYANIPNYRDRCNPTGSRAHRWKGGVSFEKYGPVFNRALKDKIRERDGFTCQVCKVHESTLKEKLSVHHINFMKLYNEEHNLISLCRHCHLKLNLRTSLKLFYFDKFVPDLKLEDLNQIYSILEV